MKKKKESHPVVNSVLIPVFFEQFKDFGELSFFIKDLYARAMEQMIGGKPDGHLGYSKHSPEGILTVATPVIARPARR